MTFIVLGNITVDEAMAAPVWPAPGQTIVVGAPTRDLGGKGLNQAMVLKRAGADVRLVAAIGQDDLASWILDGIAEEGFAPEDLIRLPLPSDRSLIFVGPGGENAIASIIECSAALTEDQATAAITQAGAGDILVLQGNLSLATTRAACLAARRIGLRTLFNPSPMQAGFDALLPLIDLLVVNESEAMQLGEGAAPETLLRNLHEAGAADVVMTLGGRGSRAFGSRGAASAPAMPAVVADTTGAGDTYMGLLAAALFEHGLPIERAMRVASAAAAITVTRHGTRSAFPSKGEIEALFATVV